MLDDLQAEANSIEAASFAQGQIGRREVYSQPVVRLFAQAANPLTMVSFGAGLYLINESILKAGEDVAAIAANQDGKFHPAAFVEAFVRTCGLSNDPSEQVHLPSGTYFGIAVSNDNGATWTAVPSTVKPTGITNGGQWCVFPTAFVKHYIFGTSTTANRSPTDDPIVLVAGIGGSTQHTVADHRDVQDLAVAIYTNEDLSNARVSFDISLEARQVD